MTEEERKKEFIKAYGELVEQHKMDFVNFPVFVPAPDGSFKIVMQNAVIPTEQAVKSPFVAEAKVVQDDPMDVFPTES